MATNKSKLQEKVLFRKNGDFFNTIDYLSSCVDNIQKNANIIARRAERCTK